MNVKIAMPNEYWKLLKKSLNIANDFFNLNFVRAFSELFNDAFVTENDVYNVEEFSKKMLYLFVGTETYTDRYDKIDKLFSKMSFQNGDYQLEEEDLSFISHILDFIIRIWIGQWHELDKVISIKSDSFITFNEEINRTITEIRNEMIPKFKKRGILSPYASFGIYSKELSEDIRKIYGIYKKIRFVLFGDTRDSSICDVNYMQNIYIELPNKSEFIVGSDLSGVKVFLDSLKSKYDVYSRSKKVSYVEEYGNLYVYVNDMLSVRVDKGTKIIVQYNRWPVIERDGKIFNFETTVSA